MSKENLNNQIKNKYNIKLLADIFFTFFKIGSFTFGGGYAMLPLIEKEVVYNKKWIDEESIIDVFAVSTSLPGAIAINSSTFIGYKLAGRIGAGVATLGMVLPSFLIITAIASLFKQFEDSPSVKAAFIGIRSAVTGLIFIAALKIARTSIKDKITAFIAALTIILVLFFNVHAIFAILGGALAGIVIYYSNLS